MIELYGASTPNVLKIEIMLEEVGLDYTLRHVDVWKGEQFEPGFIERNPTSKVPVLVDNEGPEPLTIFESAAILIYLAEKKQRLLPASGHARYDVLEWTIFQAASFGPTSGQFTHFNRQENSTEDYARSRYTTELRRLYGILDERLQRAPYIGGWDYSIADIAVLPWILNNSRMFRERFPFLDYMSGDLHGLSSWAARCLERKTVQVAIERHLVLKSGMQSATDDEKDRFFGRGKYAYAGRTDT